MSTLSHPRLPVNSSLSPLAIAWHVLGRAAEKEAVRDALAANSAHHAVLTICGEIDGEQIAPVSLSAVLTVADDSERAASQTPEPPKLIAYLLGKMNPATRDAVLRELPEQFAANEYQYPAVSAAVAEASDAMLKRIRAKKVGKIRGAVSCKYMLGQPESKGSIGRGRRLAIVG